MDLHYDNLLNLENTPDQELMKIQLESWGMGHLYQQLKNLQLDIVSFRWMTEKDLEKIFAYEQLGALISFRQKLIEWRISNGYEVHSQSLDSSIPLTRYLSDLGIPNCSSSCVCSQRSLSGSSPELYDYLPSASNIINQKFSINNYLQTNGKCVQLECEQNNNQLPSLMREKLIKDVIQYYIENKRLLHHNDFEELAIEICAAFTNERKETYYCNTGKYPSGRLYNAYRNSSSRLRAANLFPREKKNKLSRQETTACNEEENPSFGDDNEDQTWLKVYMSPFDLILSKWAATVVVRRSHIDRAGKHISSIIQAWPKYTHADGAQLIDIDFNHIHPGKETNLISKWEYFCQRIIPISKEIVKDKFSKTYYKRLELLTSEQNDERDFIILNLLHAVLVPTNSAKIQKQKKFGSSALIEKASCYTQISKLYKERKDYYKSHITFQPEIFVIEKEEEPISYYTIVDSIIY